MICFAWLCVLAVTSITDGDTFRAGDESLRVFGAIAPERGQPGYQEAKDAMRAIVWGQQLACERAGPVSFFRYVVACEMLSGPNVGQDLACLLIRSGTVLEAPSYSGGIYGSCRPPETTGGDQGRGGLAP